MCSVVSVWEKSRGGPLKNIITAFGWSEKIWNRHVSNAGLKEIVKRKKEKEMATKRKKEWKRKDALPDR
jgi:hypothetical protein